MSDITYNKSVIDFITVAVEFCAFLENSSAPLTDHPKQSLSEVEVRQKWIDSMLKILPLMYLKASLLPETPVMHDEAPPTFVKESDYLHIANRVAEMMGDEDAYLDVFVEDMKYSDTPVSAFVSENIADIYQDVRNLVSVYQYELTEQMNDALHTCISNFREYWGQKLVNSLRPLHAIKYRESDGMNDNESSQINTEDLWD
jgi:hypothetical protein